MFFSLSRIKAIGPWLHEARHAFMCAAVIIVSLYIALRPHTGEPTIRLTGLALQILGILTVAWGISETRALFGHPSLASKVKGWIGRFPLLKRETRLEINGTFSAVGDLEATAYHYVKVGDNPTVESLRDALEKNVIMIHESICQVQTNTRTELRKAAQALKHEEESRRIEEKAIRDMLEATGTGGFHISAIGAAWLFFGAILGTASAEIAALLR